MPIHYQSFRLEQVSFESNDKYESCSDTTQETKVFFEIILKVNHQLLKHSSSKEGDLTVVKESPNPVVLKFYEVSFSNLLTPGTSNQHVCEILSDMNLKVNRHIHRDLIHEISDFALVTVRNIVDSIEKRRNIADAKHKYVFIKETIDILNKRVYSETEAVESETEETLRFVGGDDGWALIEFEGRDGGCVICQEALSGRLEITKLPCAHTFHGKCLLEWFQRSLTCPLCRFLMPPI